MTKYGHHVTPSSPPSVIHYSSGIESACYKTQSELELAVHKLMIAVLAFVHNASSGSVDPKLASLALYLITFRFSQVRYRYSFPYRLVTIVTMVTMVTMVTIVISLLVTTAVHMLPSSICTKMLILSRNANQLPPIRAIFVVSIGGVLWATYKVFSRTVSQLLTWLLSSRRYIPYMGIPREGQHHIWASHDDTNYDYLPRRVTCCTE